FQDSPTQTPEHSLENDEASGWEYPDESTDEATDESEPQDFFEAEADTEQQCECAGCGHRGGREALADEAGEVTPVPAGTRPPVRSSATLRNAWRAYRCATGRMV